MGPLGADLGSLGASLLLAWCAAKARERGSAVEAAKGGYARHMAVAKMERWSVHGREVLVRVVGVLSMIGKGTRMFVRVVEMLLLMSFPKPRKREG